MSNAPGDARPNVRTRFTELDGLRGLAAFAVVFFHLRDYVERLDPPSVLDEVVNGGYMMVDLFFVLSGFVLAKKMLSTETAGDFARFSLMRIRRFAPLHVTAWGIALLLLVLHAIMQFAGNPQAPRTEAFTAPADTPWAWVSSLLLLQGFFGPEFSGYSAAWSLSIELWCNVIIVGAIALIGPRRFKPWVGPAALLLGAALLATTDHRDPNTVGQIAAGRGFYGLGIGMVVHRFYLGGLRLHRDTGGTGRSRRMLAGLGAVLMVLVLGLAMYRSDLVKQEHFLPMALISALTVYALAIPAGGPVHRLCNTRVVQWLGSRSFALYALHGPVLLALEWVVRYLDYNKKVDRVNVAVILLTVLGSLLAAEIGHRRIERLWENWARARRDGAGEAVAGRDVVQARHARRGRPAPARQLDLRTPPTAPTPTTEAKQPAPQPSTRTVGPVTGPPQRAVSRAR